MAKAARKGDVCSGHGCFPPTPVTSGSGDVFINGIPAARVDDSAAAHGCGKCPPHGRSIAAGSSSVFINGLPAARVGDAISCGGNVAVGSGNVFIGDAGGSASPSFFSDTHPAGAILNALGESNREKVQENSQKYSDPLSAGHQQTNASESVGSGMSPASHHANPTAEKQPTDAAENVASQQAKEPSLTSDTEEHIQPDPFASRVYLEYSDFNTGATL